MSKDRTAVVLAAGKGTRMKSELPKVAVEVLGKPMLLHVLDRLVGSGLKRIILVVGYKRDVVQSLVPDYPGVSIQYVIQEEQNGTAHALMCAREALSGFSGTLLVACGDMPLIQQSTFQGLMDRHEAQDNKATVLSAHLEDPKGYGRLVRNEDGLLIRIVEEKDATDEIRKIQETNTGTYAFDAPEIFEVLSGIGTENAQKEYYLPDAVEIFRKQGASVNSLELEDPTEALGANSKEDVALIETKMEKAQAGT